MSFLADNAAAFAVGAAISLVSWMFAGTRADLMRPVVPWLFVLLAEVIVCFPQRHAWETSYDARVRTWREMKKDPFVWTCLAFLLVLLVPFLNKGLCPGCDAAAIAAGAQARPPLPFLPYCVNRLQHLTVVLWFAAALPCAVAARHSMARRGKRLLVALAVWNGFVLAIYGFVQQALGAETPLWADFGAIGLRHPDWGRSNIFATFGYANMAGDYFVLLFGLAVALWRDRCSVVDAEKRKTEKKDGKQKRRGDFWRRNLHLIPAAVFFCAAANTLSRASIILLAATATLYFVHAFVSFLSRRRKEKRAWPAFWSILLFSALVAFGVSFAPEDVKREMDTVDAEEVLDRVTGKRECHSTVATRLWKENFFFGCGGWGYPHLAPPLLPPKERKAFANNGGANVHNDYLQFLAEHGTVGFALLASLVAMLVAPVVRGWAKLAAAARFAEKSAKPPKPVQVFALPAPAFCILVAAGATLVHSFADCPLRCPAILVLFFAALAAVPGFMPKQQRR